MGDSLHAALPADFPAEMLQQGCDLRPVLGIDEVAWPYPLVFRALDWLEQQGLAILGGDVYAQDDHELWSTGDNWYLDRTGEQADAEWHFYVRRSAEKTRAYIEAYHVRNGEPYLYSLVSCDEPYFQQHIAPSLRTQRST